MNHLKIVEGFLERLELNVKGKNWTPDGKKNVLGNLSYPSCQPHILAHTDAIEAAADALANTIQSGGFKVSHALPLYEKVEFNGLFLMDCGLIVRAMRLSNTSYGFDVLLSA